jgi:hypothetical protein
MGTMGQIGVIGLSHSDAPRVSLIPNLGLVPPPPLEVAVMDIDIVDEPATYQNNTSSSQSTRRPIIAPVDDAHPFDLEGYISNYTGEISIHLGAASL